MIPSFFYSCKRQSGFLLPVRTRNTSSMFVLLVLSLASPRAPGSILVPCTSSRRGPALCGTICCSRCPQSGINCCCASLRSAGAVPKNPGQCVVCHVERLHAIRHRFHIIDTVFREILTKYDIIRTSDYMRYAWQQPAEASL